MTNNFLVTQNQSVCAGCHRQSNECVEQTGSTAAVQTQTHLYGSSRIGLQTDKTVADQTITLNGGVNATLRI